MRPPTAPGPGRADWRDRLRRRSPRTTRLPTAAATRSAGRRLDARAPPGTAELNLRTIAQLAGISQAQTSRLLPELVDLGVVGRLSRALPRPPVSVIVFGSFARREADARSDIDVVVVRPSEIDEDDDEWVNSLDWWRGAVRRLTGNPVEVLEVSVADAARKLRGRSQVWADIRRDGHVVHGFDIADLREARIG